MAPVAPARPSGLPDASGGAGQAVRTIAHVQTGSALGNESPNHPGLVGLFDDALMAARSWIASEVLLDDRIAAACSAIRLVPDASEGMSLAL